MVPENDEKTERREYYRVTCQAAVEFRLVDNPQQPIEELFTLPPEYQLLNEYRSINHETGSVLKQITDDDKVLGGYLKSVNRKLDILASAIVSKLAPTDSSNRQTIDISEGGLKCQLPFHGKEQDRIALKLTLLPDNLIFTLKAVIKVCSDKESARSGMKGFEANIEFIDMEAADQSLLSKFVIQQQRRRLHRLK